MSTTTASSGQSRRIDELERENQLLRKVLGAKSHYTEIFARHDWENSQEFILQKLMGCSDQNHVWLALHCLLNFDIRTAHIEARADQGVTDSQMRYNLGRETALEDFRNRLISLWVDANKVVGAG